MKWFSVGWPPFRVAVLSGEKEDIVLLGRPRLSPLGVGKRWGGRDDGPDSAKTRPFRRARRKTFSDGGPTIRPEVEIHVLQGRTSIRSGQTETLGAIQTRRDSAGPRVACPQIEVNFDIDANGNPQRGPRRDLATSKEQKIENPRHLRSHR